VPASLANRGRRSRENVALHPKLLLLTAELCQFLALRHGQGIAVRNRGRLRTSPPLLAVSGRDPVPDRLSRGLELPGKARRVTPGSDQLDHLAPELRRIRSMRLGHHGTPRAKASWVSTEPGQTHNPSGIGLLARVGLVIIGAALGMAAKAWTASYRCHLACGPAASWIVPLGRAGFAARRHLPAGGRLPAGRRPAGGCERSARPRRHARCAAGATIWPGALRACRAGACGRRRH
jgi:hypothetical protein